ncbi:MAG: PP2C family protein-serine/threonine phosphatase [Acidobacteriota bacterium]
MSRQGVRAFLGRRPVVAALVLAGLAATQQLAHAVARDSAFDDLLTVLLVIWIVVTGVVALRYLWRKLTYRVGVRLFLSYLLIGLVPFPLLGLLGAVTGYMLVGQYGARAVGTVIEAESQRLGSRVQAAVRELGRGDATAAQAAAAGSPGERDEPAVHTEWLLADGNRSWRSAGAGALPAPAWVAEGEWRGPVLLGSRPFLAAVARQGGRLAVVVMPLDIANANALCQGEWFAVRFLASQHLAKVAARSGTEKHGVTVIVGEKSDTASSGVRLGGEEVSSEQIEHGWAQQKLRTGTFWQRLTIAWMKSFQPPRDWQDGAETKGWLLVGLVKVSVGGAAADLFTSPRNIGAEVSTALLITAAVFAGIYLVAVSFAVIMILSITRSTARLTRGEREIARGNLDYRIPVKRRDQLGDLAVAFNSTAESIKRMLVDVAEKERLARELELAREIQESLLPRRDFRHGGLAVHALFRPAAEVGGDYFDLFPLESGRLIIAAGDVAGHGLSTGLLMAMVKSAVAAFIQEGHRGKDLLERLNELLLQHPVRHRMVTLALIEIDERAAAIEVTNSGHPPVYVLSPDGAVDEVMLSALPVGHRWIDPPASWSGRFQPGSRLVVYSDGLVEALNQAGEQFGYEALRSILQRDVRLPAQHLLASLVAELERHTGGAPLADDLTVLIVESVAPPTE